MVLVTHEHDIAAFADAGDPLPRRQGACATSARRPSDAAAGASARLAGQPRDDAARHAQGRARGAAHEQAALVADDARHHHRRRGGDRHGGRRRRRAGARRGPDQEPRLQPDHRAVRQLHRRRRADGRGLAADDHRGRRVRAAARDPAGGGLRAAAARQRARSWSATATGTRRSWASRPSTSCRATGAASSGRLLEPQDVESAGKVVAARPDRRAQPLRRGRSRRRDGAHPPRPARGDRRAGAQGPEHGGPGPGRRGR